VKKALSWICGAIGLVAGTPGFAVEAIKLYPGYVTKLACQGRLLVSAVGNEELVRLDALPRELGCGVLLKPRKAAGRTNLLLETSTGSVRMIVTIGPVNGVPSSVDLAAFVQGGAQ
jgi:hypothetical protein